jgi:hypothetical protein
VQKLSKILKYFLKGAILECNGGKTPSSPEMTIFQESEELVVRMYQ